MAREKVRYEIIERAVQQDDGDAVMEILAHYRSYIRTLAKQEIILENGEQIQIVNEELVAELEEKLITSLSKFRFLPEEKSV